MWNIRSKNNKESSGQLSLLSFPNCFIYSNMFGFLTNIFFFHLIYLFTLWNSIKKENKKKVTCLELTESGLRINAVLLSRSIWRFGGKKTSPWVSTVSGIYLAHSLWLCKNNLFDEWIDGVIVRWCWVWFTALETLWHPLQSDVKMESKLGRGSFPPEKVDFHGCQHKAL